MLCAVAEAARSSYEVRLQTRVWHEPSGRLLGRDDPFWSAFSSQTNQAPPKKTPKSHGKFQKSNGPLLIVWIVPTKLFI